MLNVGALREGYVLDHIKAGKAMTIYHDLKLDKLDCTVAIIKNARSQKMGKKDIIKVECPIEDLDLLYMTRVQKERFFNEEDYVRMKDFYVLDKQKLELAPKDMYILHPLPRVNEISVEVDSDPRAAYFKQVQYGVYVRMALILTLLEVELPC